MSDPLHEELQKLRLHIEQVVLGKPDVVRMVLVALLAGEHVLLEDVPGVGKTLVAKALAKSISGHFSRLQFTPDLLPSDIIGSSIYNSKESQFTFSPGPVFANIVLADEINRAPPRTQSALLEAMSERQVSVDGQSHTLPQPFLVIATQNPFEFEGTYLLPESQLDRFLLRTNVGYPARQSEREVLTSHRQGEPVDSLKAVIDPASILKMQSAVREVRVDPLIVDYMLDIVDKTRTSEQLHVGVSTRGALSLYRACQAWAYLQDRTFVTPDDVKRLVTPVFAHRVVPRGMLPGADRSAVEAIMDRILQSVKVPV